MIRKNSLFHYNYTGLIDDEVSDYIRHKLSLAGAAASIMDPAALAAVHSYTQGNPRLIDNLMTDALTIGAQHKKWLSTLISSWLPSKIRDCIDEIFMVHKVMTHMCHGLVSKADLLLLKQGYDSLRLRR